MSNKFFKSFFAVAMVLGAALGFVACMPEDETSKADPKVELSESTLRFTAAEESKSVNVTSNSNWTVVVDAADWITVTPTSGKNNGTITVHVAENTSGVARSTEVKVSALNAQYNNAVWDTKKLTISQSADENEAVEEEVLYSDNFDAQIAEKQIHDGDDYARFPFIDEIEFANAEGPASAGVTYGGNKMSVRSNRQSNYNNYPASGNNNIFFGDGGIFLVKNIAPLKAGHMSYKISFVAEKYHQDHPDSQFSADEFKLYISKDGVAWAEIEYTRAGGNEPGVYSLNTADFTLTTVPEALHIKFTTSFARAYRIDDLKLMVGNGGQTVDLDNIEIPAPAEKVTIAEVLALGQDATINGAIEGIVVSNYELNNLTSMKGMYVQDETGALQFFLGGNHTFAFGTKVQIDLTGAKLGAYNGAVQVSGLALDKITAISTGNTVTPKVVTMDDFLANKYEGQYISIEGVQVVEADLTKTWSTTDSHTSINMQNAEGKQFVVFSSKYATYGAETVAQGAGTISGISSINNGVMQIIFAQVSDYAGLTGARFVAGEPEEQDAVKVTIAEFLAAAVDSTIYELNGTITSVTNTEYGNFYIKDDTAEVYVYGLHSLEGAEKYWAESGAKVGDDITIRTVRAEYNGTPQGTNAKCVKVTTPGTRAFMTLSKTALAFSDKGGVQNVDVAVYNVASELVVTSSNSQFTAAYSNGVLAVTAAENTTTEAIEGVLTLTAGDLTEEIAVSQVAQGDINELVITFPGNPSAWTDKYTESFKITLQEVYSFTFNAINNGKEKDAWTAVRFGRKLDDSVASIVTDNAIPYAVKSVNVNFTQVGSADLVNSSKLIVATDSAFANVVEEVAATVAVGEVVYTVTNPAKDQYYKLEYDTKKHGSKNGEFRFDRVTYTK